GGCSSEPPGWGGWLSRNHQPPRRGSGEQPPETSQLGPRARWAGRYLTKSGANGVVVASAVADSRGVDSFGGSGNRGNGPKLQVSFPDGPVPHRSPLSPEDHAHLAVQGPGRDEKFVGFRSIVGSAVERAEPAVAMGDEGSHLELGREPPRFVIAL